jgi:alpha-N-arabinofuranosidase
MQMQHYTLKNNMVVDAMRKVDPGVSLTAVGDLDTINKAHDPEQVKSAKTCSHIMLEQCADHMELLSEHFYDGRLPWTKTGNVKLEDHVALLKKSIRAKAEGHRKLQASLPNLKGRIIPIAMDEWNYWHREYVFGELGCIYNLADGLGVAAGLHEFFRQSDIIHMAHYAQTVNVIGAIKTSRTSAEMETTGLVLQMYRQHFGQIPLLVEGAFGPCDISAALTTDKAFLTLGVVNPQDKELTLKPEITGAKLAKIADSWHIGAASPDLHNSPGKTRVVDIKHSADLDVLSDLQVPPYSAAVFRIPLK